MPEYNTRYPRTISLDGGQKHTIPSDERGVEQLTVIVRKNVEEIRKILKLEGFTNVKFEHVQESQIGHGFSLKLEKPWEMHLRLFDLKKGIIAIQAEVEVSRDYLQHLFCQRTPVIYEIETLLKKYQIEYEVWNDKVRNQIQAVFDNYKIKITSPSIPVFAWKPMLFFIGAVGILYLWKYLNTI